MTRTFKNKTKATNFFLTPMIRSFKQHKDGPNKTKYKMKRCVITVYDLNVCIEIAHFWKMNPFVWSVNVNDFQANSHELKKRKVSKMVQYEEILWNVSSKHETSLFLPKFTAKYNLSSVLYLKIVFNVIHFERPVFWCQGMSMRILLHAELLKQFHWIYWTFLSRNVAILVGFFSTKFNIINND